MTEQVVARIPVFLPGNDRNWDQSEGQMVIDDEGTMPFANWTRDIRLNETGEVFDSLSAPAEKYGLLEREIHKAIVNGTQVFPYGFTFMLLD